MIARGPSVPATFDDSPMSSIDRARPPKLTPPPPLPRNRAPQSSSTFIQEAFDSDFGEDTVPEAQSLTALTDQDDRGVRRS